MRILHPHQLRFGSPGARRGRARSAFALVEVMIAGGLTTLLVLVICGFTVYSGYNFASLFNYVDLDDMNRNAMDRITRDVRQALRVKAATTNTLTLVGADNLDIAYVYNPAQDTLTRKKGNEPTEVLLTECQRFSFTMAMRNPVGGSYDIYPTATATNCKVVNVSWKCSRKILGREENTESVQTARIVIRKQGT